MMITAKNEVLTWNISVSNLLKVSQMLNNNRMSLCWKETQEVWENSFVNAARWRVAALI